MPYERLSAPLTSDFPNEWYDLNLGDHFWFAWRQEVLRRVLVETSSLTSRPLKVLDIGCGMGTVRQQLERMTSWTVDGAEVSAEPLANALPSRGRTFLYNIEDRREELKEHYDAIVLFDVLEHIQDPKRFLTAALWHLKANGLILINVPALQALYSRYDALVGHFVRYSRSSLTALLHKEMGAAILDMRYWGFSLVPAAWLRKFVLRKAKTPQEAISLGFEAPSPWVNSAMKTLQRIETSLLSHPFIGSSLMVLARKVK